MNTLERSLDELQSNLTSTSPRRFLEANSIVEDIRGVCMRASSEAEIANCSSLLFNRDKGILSFLVDKAAGEQFDKAKGAALSLLTDYIQKGGQRLRPYAAAIKNCCLKTFQDPRASVKNASFEPLKALLTLGFDISSSSTTKDSEMQKLIDTYWNELFRGSQVQPTVKANVLELLGLIAEHYPEDMMTLTSGGTTAARTTRADALIKMYFTFLDKEIAKPKPEYPIIVGSVRGLTSCLVQFTKSVEEGEKTAAEKIYGYAKKFIQDVKASDYKLYIAALCLIAKHASQFKEYLAVDHEAMYRRIRGWCEHSNRDLKNAAFSALESFLQQVASVIVSSNLHLDKKREIFEFFIREFGGIFRSPESDARSVSIAIRGYGYFAPACRLFCSDAQIRTMFHDMLQRTEILYLRDAQQSEESLAHLPSFLNSIASILRQIGTLPDSLLGPIEALAAYFLATFPAVPKSQRASGCKAIAFLLFALFEKGEILRAVLDRLIYPGLMSTLSHPVTTDDSFEEGAVDTASVLQENVHADYRVLWLSILDDSNLHVNISDDARQQLYVAVHDAFMRAILRVIKRLDLSASSDEDGGGADANGASVAALGKQPEDTGATINSVAGGGADVVTSHLHARVPKDFQVFISCVAFCKAVLPRLPSSTVHRWVHLFGQEVIVMATRNPVVSGFYKLFGICLSLCERSRYFEDIGSGEDALIRAARAINAMETDNEHPGDDDQDHVPTDTAVCFLLFRRFVGEVLVRLHQYTDELLAACLQAVLASPTQFLEGGIRDYVPALKIAFRVGLGYLPLANIALDAMERWAATLPRDAIEDQLKQVISGLNEYLRVSTTSADVADDALSATAVPVGASSLPKPSSRRKATAKKQPSAAIWDGGDGTAIGDFRIRVVRFLGLLGGNTSAAVVDAPRTNGDSAGLGNGSNDKAEHVAWSSDNAIKLGVPFKDVKSSIDLDALLPRVVALAVESSDRQTKVAACELLHALTLYALGLSQAGNQSPEPFVLLFGRLMPKLLVLACDVEVVARQLFRPLVFQMIHYLSQAKKFESPLVAVLLNAITDGLGQADATSLRDLCAACTAEFFAYTIKQTTPSEMETKPPANIKSLLKRIYSMAYHPSVSLRLGAAAAFNALYKLFREHDRLVDVYALEMLHAILQSLRIADADDPELGTQKQMALAATNMVRTVVKHASLLCDPGRGRRAPVGWETGRPVTLASFVDWLFGECGRYETEYRHVCMELFFQFAPRCGQKDAATAAQWVHSRVSSQGVKYIVGVFERRQPQPVSTGTDGVISVDDQLALFTELQASLECYNWAFAGGFLTDDSALVAPQSRLIGGVASFFNDHVARPVSQLEAAGHTAREIERYRRERCTVVVRAFELANTLIERMRLDQESQFAKRLFSIAFIRSLLSAALDPSALGFDIADLKMMARLPLVTGPLVISMAKSFASGEIRNAMNGAVRDALASGWAREISSGEIDFGRNPHAIASAVSGYEQLLAADLLMGSLMSEGVGASPLSSKLMSAVFEAGATSEMDPTHAHAAGRVLELAFLLKVDVDKFLRMLLDARPTFESDQISLGDAADSSSSDGRTKGAAFFGNFKLQIVLFVARHCDELVPKLLSPSRLISAAAPSVIPDNGKAAGESAGIATRKGLTPALQVVLEMFDAARVEREVGTRRKRIAAVCAASAVKLSSFGLPTASADEQAALFQLIRGTFDLDPEEAAPLVRTYLDLLSLRGPPLSFKVQLLGLLPRVLSCPSADKMAVESTLKQLVSSQFPIHSTELPESGAAYRMYVSALDLILVTLESVGWPGLLNVLVLATCREPKHRHSDAIRRSVGRFVARLSEDDVSSCVGVCHTLVVDAKQPPVVRRAVTDLLVLPMLAAAPLGGLARFVAVRAKELVKTVSDAVPKKYAGASEEEIESDLLSKWYVYRVLACAYDRLPAAMVNQQGNHVNEAFHGPGGKGNEMTFAITKVANAVRTEPSAPKDECAGDLRRQYRCAAWNALAAILVCTQDNPDLYGRLLFAENAAKGMLMWENLVDSERTYTFDVELVVPYDRKAKLASIRQSGGAPVVGMRPQAGAGDKASRLRYLSSQYLVDSSLSQDITANMQPSRAAAAAAAAEERVDASGASGSAVVGSGYGSLSASLVEALGPQDEEGAAAGVGGMGAPGEATSYVVQEDDLESDDLNAHECMPWFLRVVDHVMGKLMKQPDGDGAVDKMPLWMSEMHRRFDAATGVHMNIRYLIAKVVTNRPSTFRPYGKHWIEAMMRLVLSFESQPAPAAAPPNLTTMASEGPSPLEGLNYFVVDLFVSMLSWAPVAVPEGVTQSSIATRLVRFLVARCYHPTRAVLKNDIEIFKTAVECWRASVSVPMLGIYRNLSSPNPDDARNTTGIQLLAVVVVNDLGTNPAADPEAKAAGLDERKLLDALVANVAYKRKEVYSAAAEVVGMILAQKNSAKDVSGRDALMGLLRVRLKRLQETQETDRLIVCLHKAHINYPEVADEYLTNIFYLLPNLYGEFKTQALEMILARAGDVPDVFMNLKGRDLPGMLRHRDEATQRLVLAIVLKVLKGLDKTEIRGLLGNILQTFPSHDSAACRELMYDILAWLYDHARDALSLLATPGAESDEDLAVRNQLLLGLSDENDGVRMKVRRFWNHETRLPLEILRRLPHVFTTLYTPASEASYLGQAVWLLLEPSRHGTDWDLPILSAPLGSCVFKEYAIDASWQHRNAMTPMFAATQSSQSDATYAGTMMEVGLVRATQDASLQFTPTQDMGAAKFTPGVVGRPPMRGDTFTQSQAAASKSSLMFRQTRLSSSQTQLGATIAGGNSGASQSADAKANERMTNREVLLLRRRFVKNSAPDASIFHARRIQRMKDVQADTARRQRAARANTVTMLRSYKIGEIPDVLIKYRELVQPLQSLATRDANVARQLFRMLFSTLYAEIGRSPIDAAKAAALATVRAGFVRLLQRSSLYFPPFVACMEEVSYVTDLTLERSSVAVSSLRSITYPTGILVLEKGIATVKEANLATRKEVEDRPKPPKGKRARTEPPAQQPSGMAAASVGDAADEAGGGVPEDWLEVSRLYRASGDFDVVLGISRKELAESIDSKTKDALALEADGDYHAAQLKFAEALSEHTAGNVPAAGGVALVERRLCITSRLECCNRLADWSALEAAVGETLSSECGSVDPSCMWQERNRAIAEEILPYFVRAHVKLLVGSIVEMDNSGKDDDAPRDGKMIYEFIDAAMAVETHREQLLRFTDELAVLSVVRGDLDRARYYSAQSTASFLADWSSLHPQMKTARHARLQLLQRTIEMDEYLRHVADPVKASSVDAFRGLLRRWSSRFPHPRLQPLNVWDDVVSYRELYVRGISETLRESVCGVRCDGDDGDDDNANDPLVPIRGEIATQRILSFLKVSEAARKQRNYAVSAQYYKKTFVAMLADKAHLTNLPELKIKWLHVGARRQRDQSRSEMLDSIDRVNNMAQTLLSLTSEDANVLKIGVTTARRHHRLKFDALVLLESIEDVASSLAESVHRDKLARLLGESRIPTDPTELSTLLLRRAMASVTSAVTAADHPSDAGPSVTSAAVASLSAAKARLALASFAGTVLRRGKEAALRSELGGRSSFGAVVVENTLAAMQLGLPAARDHFPRALEVVGDHLGDCMDAFLLAAPGVPCWMFLQWLSQMVAVLDKPEGRAVVGPLEAIAKAYPQALYFPLRISREQLCFAPTKEGSDMKAAIERVESLVSSPTLDRFVKGLEELTHLENVLIDWIRNELPALIEKRDAAQARSSFEELKAMLFGVAPVHGTESAKAYRPSFANEFKGPLLSACGTHGEKIADKKVDGDSLRKQIESLIPRLRERLSGKAPGLLKEYSPWLASFRASDYPDSPIEIPGQYAGLSKPHPAYHVHVSSFDERVVVLSSLRKPKMISIRGSDEMDHRYMVKGGEDLRLDQRILQLFALMNRVYASDARCAQRGLSVRTYLVVPASTRVGIIEWMSDTRTLKDVVEQQLVADGSADGSAKGGPLNAVRTEYVDHFLALDYMEMYKSMKLTDCAALMAKLHAMLPADTLRRAMFGMAAGPEAFVTLRSKYATSLAATSICQYVVGVGDRHLSNHMIDTATGGIVAIDFGHAFGSATQFLPVPEMVPFRLSRQMRGVMTPLSVDVSLRPAMVHCLRALQEQCDTLLVPMSVFIKEPLLDWEQNARRQAKAQSKTFAPSLGAAPTPTPAPAARGGSQGGRSRGAGAASAAGAGGAVSSEAMNVERFARQKLEVVRRKLCLENPAHITAHELGLGHARNKMFEKMTAVAMGDATRFRSRVGARCQSVEEQVDCLIDMATDPNILVRMWHGWEAWV